MIWYDMIYTRIYMRLANFYLIKLLQIFTHKKLATIAKWNLETLSECLSNQWRYYGRKILIAFVTWSRQKGHFDTAEEHFRHNTWPQGTIVISTSELRQTRQVHAAFAVSASLVDRSTFSWTIKYNVECHFKLNTKFHTTT